VTKGGINVDHPVQITEDPSVPKDLNLVFWLRIHLRERGFDLNHLNNQQQKGEEKVWHWSPNAAREIFSDRACRAGF